jgi:CRP-like cAMP-binding protein
MSVADLAAQILENANPEMRGTPVKQSLLSELQGRLSADLFAGATPVRRAADEVLFVAGDAGNGCYRVEDGLVKVTMMSRAGVERILAFLGPGSHPPPPPMPTAAAHR